MIGLWLQYDSFFCNWHIYESFMTEIWNWRDRNSLRVPKLGCVKAVTKGITFFCPRYLFIYPWKTALIGNCIANWSVVTLKQKQLFSSCLLPEISLGMYSAEQISLEGVSKLRWLLWHFIPLQDYVIFRRPSTSSFCLL